MDMIHNEINRYSENGASEQRRGLEDHLEEILEHPIGERRADRRDDREQRNPKRVLRQFPPIEILHFNGGGKRRGLRVGNQAIVSPSCDGVLDDRCLLARKLHGGPLRGEKQVGIE
jgi:hypothetical protein